MIFRYLPLSLVLVPALVFAPILLGQPPAAAQPGPTLSAEGKKFLDSLMKDFLFDPKDADRVSVKTPARTVWGTTEEVQIPGWFVPGKEGEAGRVYFTDGASIAAPPGDQMQKVDFAAQGKARYLPLPADKKGFARSDDLVRKLRLSAVGAVADHDLALAAWFYRLGQEELAARALAVAGKSDEDPRDVLRRDLAWSAYASMVHAYMVRADEEALAHGERLLRLYPDEVNNKDFQQANQVLDDLKRRQKKESFGKEPPASWPDDFDKWDAAKKTAYLINALDEVDARQVIQPGWPDLANDRRVAELIRVGEPAVPALIDAVEKDDRLTRSVQFFRDFARHRTVLGAREAALTALSHILRTRLFEPTSTTDTFTSRGTKEARATAKRLRGYWKEYGSLPFDERMMKVLINPKSSFQAKREAAGNLAAIKPIQAEAKSTQTDLFGDKPPAVKQNPVVGKFSNPSVAEATVAAMDAELQMHDLLQPKDRADFIRRAIEVTFISALVELNDKRVAAELVRRASAAKSLRTRLQWSEAAHYLGERKPLASLADEFRAGKVKLASAVGGVRELRAMLVAFLDAATPEADAALQALADVKHPLHKTAAAQVLAGNPTNPDDQVWFAHVFCLPILRMAVDNTSLTGTTYALEQGGIVRKNVKETSSAVVPAFLGDPAVRRDRAAERTCDAAAATLAELIVGLPRYHPLFKDPDKKLASLKSTFDLYAGKYRALHPGEREALSLSQWPPVYIPDIKPLERPATAEDIKQGNAIFHLAGKGQRAVMELPAMAMVKVDDKNATPERVLIVQAENVASGAITYGVITQHDIRSMPASALSEVKSLAALAREKSDAAKKGQEKKN